MSKNSEQDGLPGVEAGDKTALGFGGKTISRQLHRGDQLYLLLHVVISSETEKDAKNGVAYSAGSRTEILAELTPGEATQIAADHGWTPGPGPTDDSDA